MPQNSPLGKIPDSPFSPAFNPRPGKGRGRRWQKYKNSLNKLPFKLRAMKERLKQAFHPPGHGKLAFSVAGGLGDHVLAARFIVDAMALLPGEHPLIFCKRPALMAWLLSRQAFHATVLDHASAQHSQPVLSALLRVLTFVDVAHENKKLPLASAEAERRLRALVVRVNQESDKLRRFIDPHPHMDGYLGLLVAKIGSTRHEFNHAMAGLPYQGHALNLPLSPVAHPSVALQPGHYITVSNGFDEHMTSDAAKGSTKVFPHFNALMAELRKACPDAVFVHVGSAHSAPLSGADVSLLGKTSLSEVAWLLKNAALHLDNEGGLVHLAAALGTRCCVFFGPTSSAYFGYRENLNIDPAQCGNCWWMTPQWMSECVRGDAQPACLQAHDPKAISAKILASGILDRQAFQGSAHQPLEFISQEN